MFGRKSKKKQRAAAQERYLRWLRGGGDIPATTDVDTRRPLDAGRQRTVAALKIGQKLP